MQVQPDGKVVAAGNSGDHFAVVRYNANGTPDTSFGSNGVVITTISKNSIDLIEGMVLQSDGKIVVAGVAGMGMAADFALARYNADGYLDAAFGVGGKVTTNSGFVDPIVPMIGGGIAYLVLRRQLGPIPSGTTGAAVAT